MGKITIVQCIYDIANNKAFKRDGYYHKETRKQVILLPNKFKVLLFNKSVKFLWKYGFLECYFTLGIDDENGIEVITICHPFFDVFDEEFGESVTIGRIKRMRGDTKKIIYIQEEYEKKIKLYDIVQVGEHGETIEETIYKTIKRKRVKLDKIGNPIVKKVVWFKPYNLDAKYIDTDGREKLKYPYIYKLV